MTKTTKKTTKRRTQTKDLPKKKKALSKEEQKKVEGGSAPNSQFSQVTGISALLEGQNQYQA